MSTKTYDNDLPNPRTRITPNDDRRTDGREGKQERTASDGGDWAMSKHYHFSDSDVDRHNDEDTSNRNQSASDGGDETMSGQDKAEMQQKGEMGWYIILAIDEYHDEPNVGNPVRARSPEHAVRKRGMEGYERIRVYQLLEKPTGDCEYWDESVVEQ